MSESTEMAMLEAEDKMGKALEVVREDMASIRTGRAHPSMFSKLEVDYYGAPTPLQQLASFQVQDARTVLIQPYDKSSMTAVEKALRDSDLGVNPSNDGVQIRIVMPQLTEERRRDYIKLARSKGEDAKVSVRNIRRHTKDAIDKAVKDGDIGEDEGTRTEKELEALTKKHVDAIDDVLKHKEAELLEV
ncbi:ribosome recycling factor [Ornithinimicrobium sediminis]|uniref:ribosome recycling factor n=1 Tax=Ornithinimicrobium sediminis TaxID=2904603 RepID=UPI001E2B3C56|nr:ribosome recycling factor [Ornithinimicrobium sediminis]MCE0486648.1 ribosome recycling factor [Ornithinimicrobium sediminis]